jgi:hypothetical protein|nr:MAG TPA: hypothetical protein [Caudoviricetes sp.]
MQEVGIDDVLGKAVFSLAFSIMNCKKFDFKEYLG